MLPPAVAPEKNEYPRRDNQRRPGQHSRSVPLRSGAAGSRRAEIHTRLPSRGFIVRIKLGPDRLFLVQRRNDNFIPKIGIMEMKQGFKIAVAIGEGRHPLIQPGIHHDHLGIRHRISTVIMNRAVDDESVVHFMGRKRR